MYFVYRDAWNKIGSKSKKDAMLEYVNKVLDVDPEWEEKVCLIEIFDD